MYVFLFILFFCCRSSVDSVFVEILYIWCDGRENSDYSYSVQENKKTLLNAKTRKGILIYDFGINDDKKKTEWAKKLTNSICGMWIAFDLRRLETIVYCVGWDVGNYLKITLKHLPFRIATDHGQTNIILRSSARTINQNRIEVRVY